MILIQTDDAGLFNEIAEEVRLFIQGQDIMPCESDAPVSLSDNYMLVKVANANYNGCYTAEALIEAYSGGKSTRISHKENIKFCAANELEHKRYKKWISKIAVFRALKQLYPEAYTPWGSLTGIRPTRLFRELKAAFGESKAKHMFLDHFDVSPAKLDLVLKITDVQAPVLGTQSPKDADVYIGIPFCKTRCLYCSFASCLRTPKTDMESYLSALKADIQSGANTLIRNGYKIRSFYMGGGTPTILTAAELEDLLCHVRKAYPNIDAEFTVEAGRPDTIDKDKLNILKEAGVARISINPQSMNQKTLELIGRSHTAADIIKAYDLARGIGFKTINMDIIAGLPGETLEDFETTLNMVHGLKPENVTVHTLAIKCSSRLRENASEFVLPGAEVAETMLTAGARAASSNSMLPYYLYRQKYMQGNLENVGYCLPGHQCVYNIDMMEETTNIMAHGAGAISKRIFGNEHRVERIPNPKDLPTYIKKLELLSAARDRLFEYYSY